MLIRPIPASVFFETCKGYGVYKIGVLDTGIANAALSQLSYIPDAVIITVF